MTEKLEQTFKPVAHDNGSMTLCNNDVQRLIEMGVLHVIDDGFYVGRWPSTNARSDLPTTAE